MMWRIHYYVPFVAYKSADLDKHTLIKGKEVKGIYWLQGLKHQKTD